MTTDSSGPTRAQAGSGGSRARAPGPRGTWREKLHEIIFEAETPAGKGFDVVLIVLILLSVLVVMLDSVEAVRREAGGLLWAVEWIFTGLFTVEYVLRILCVRRPTKYMLSFYGIVDLLAIAPTYLSVLLPGTQYLSIIRVLRVLRVFRVLKLGHHMREADLLAEALWASRRKISVFAYVVTTLVVVFGSLMYLIEGPEHGFTNIPVSIYWTIVTLTTVGYGDITPQTFWGQALSAFIMLLGYATIAVPTGIVTAEMSSASRATRSRANQISTQVCQACCREGHESDAVYCKFCGEQL